MASSKNSQYNLQTGPAAQNIQDQTEYNDRYGPLSGVGEVIQKSMDDAIKTAEQGGRREEIEVGDVWKIDKGWMTPKSTNCINCTATVDIYGAGYIVWDAKTDRFWRQHAECHVEEELHIQQVIDRNAA